MKIISPISVVSFLLLLIGQVTIFNHLNLFGSINPMLYLLFFIFYRFESNQTLLIALSFLLGFLIDFLAQTGGAHTIASLTIGFIRPFLIRNAFGVTMETPLSYLHDNRVPNKLVFLVLLVLIHHSIYFTLVYFSWDALFLIVKYTLLTTIFSLILLGIALSFFPSKK
jgi:rod shape-determining protein MreD